MLILKQNRNVLTGTVGPNLENQSPISDGTISGSEAQWSINAQGGSLMIFHLRLSGDHLSGSITGETPDGKMSAKVDTVRTIDGASQSPSSPSDLYNQIAMADSRLFDAYNKGDLATMATLFTKDLEFYHDKGGLTHYQENLDSFKRGFVGVTKVRRELVDGTLEVYPLQGFGAVEIGIHRFYSTEPGQKERLTATANFVHVWQKTDTGWKIARAVSYDHR